MSAPDELTQQALARVGTTIRDKWRLDALLGMGGMASVYAATHRNQKRVAVKMLHPHLSIHPEVRARFLREGYVANSVGHRGVVTVDDDDVTEDGAAFLVMELLEGEPVDALWKRSGRKLPLAQVLEIGDQLLDVLAAAHDKGIVHRDLKPENLFLTNEGALKVLDFGIARVRELSSSAGGKTQIGSVMGTPAFMAPEQARARWDDVDGRTDLWAAGATLFTLLAGRHVHEAGTVNEELALAVTARAPSIASVVPDLAPEVVDLIDRALAYEKEGRWPDARKMQAALRRAQSALAGAPARSISIPGVIAAGAGPSRGAQRRWLVLGGIALAALALAGTLRALGGRTVATPAPTAEAAPPAPQPPPSDSATQPTPSVEAKTESPPATAVPTSSGPAPRPAAGAPRRERSKPPPVPAAPAPKKANPFDRRN